jgi:F0F1-type ATP synthase epsilon subunit
MMIQNPAKTNLKVIARAPFRIYYEGPARIVTATNQVGTFDILPGHADFFSVLSSGDVLIDAESGPISFSIGGGILCVSRDEVMIFVNM